jgi:hypothetical protein
LTATIVGTSPQQAVPRSLDDVIVHRCGSEGGHIFGSRPVACAGQPRFLQCQPRVIRHLTGAVAERERLEKGDDDRFLLGGQCREARRIPIRRPQRTDQRFHGHPRIVRTPEGVADESREIVPPPGRLAVTGLPIDLHT